MADACALHGILAPVRRQSGLHSRSGPATRCSQQIRRASICVQFRAQNCNSAQTMPVLRQHNASALHSFFNFMMPTHPNDKFQRPDNRLPDENRNYRSSTWFWIINVPYKGRKIKERRRVTSSRLLLNGNWWLFWGSLFSSLVQTHRVSPPLFLTPNCIRLELRACRSQWVLPDGRA